MYCIVYEFEVKAGEEQRFLESWEAITNLYLEYAKSLGSRLHRSEEGGYIAYAQWPDKETRNQASEKVPKEKISKWQKQMADSCSHIRTLREGKAVIDLLR